MLYAIAMGQITTLRSLLNCNEDVYFCVSEWIQRKCFSREFHEWISQKSTCSWHWQAREMPSVTIDSTAAAALPVSEQMKVQELVATDICEECQSASEIYHTRAIHHKWRLKTSELLQILARKGKFSALRSGERILQIHQESKKLWPRLSWHTFLTHIIVPVLSNTTFFTTINVKNHSLL